MPTPPIGIGEIPADQIARIQIGSTTRGEVLMMFGNPSDRLSDDSVFLYRWDRVRAVGGVGAPVGFPIEINDHFILAIEFDAMGRVDRLGKLSAFTHEDLTKELDAWFPGRPRAPLVEAATPLSLPARLEPSLAETVEAEFPSVIWWWRKPSSALGKADVAAVRGHLQVRSDSIVFFETLPSGGEVSYDVGFGEIKAVVLGSTDHASAARAIWLIRHDRSVEGFTLMNQSNDSADDESMREALVMLNKKIYESARR